MKPRIIASIIIAAASFLFIAGSAAAAPTSTYVQNLVITGVANAPCLTTGANGLVASTTCGSGGSSTLIYASSGIGVSASGTNGYIISNTGVTSTAGLAKGSGTSSLALWNASGTLTTYGSSACPSGYVYIVNTNGSVTCSLITIPGDLAATTVTSTWVLSSNGSNWVASAPTGGSGIASTTPWVLTNIVVASGTGIATIPTSTLKSYTDTFGYATSTGSLSSSTIWGLFSNTATGLTYTNTTGATALTSGYFIPLTASGTQWNAAYASSSLITSALGTNAFNSTAFISTTTYQSLNGWSGLSWNLLGSGNITSTISNGSTTFSLTGVIGSANGGTATTTALGSNAFNSTAFLTANQSITLSGAVTGSGATTIATTFTTSTLYGLFSGSAPITYNTSTGAIGLTIPLTLAQGGTNATSAAAARTSLGLGTISTFGSGDYLTSSTVYVTTTSGNWAGTVQSKTLGTISTFASTDYITSSTNMVNTFNGATGTVTYAPSSTLASSSVAFIFQNATTTKPSSFSDIYTGTKKTIAYVDCYEYAAATTTMELYYNTTNASSGIQQVILPSISCGIGGNSTTSFTTSTLPLGAYLFAIVSSTAGTPTQTTLNISATKL